VILWPKSQKKATTKSILINPNDRTSIGTSTNHDRITVVINIIIEFDDLVINHQNCNIDSYHTYRIGLISTDQ
jgi:hypothetical protein